MMNLIEKFRDFLNRIAFWWSFFRSAFSNEEILFIDVLYTKGVEAYAYGTKDSALFVASKHYRKGWSDFERYDKRVNGSYKPTHKEILNGTAKATRSAFIREYVTGVSCAYVHGHLFVKEKIAQDIMNDTEASGAFFGETTEHMQIGFKNALVVMNKQIKLLQSDPTTARIKEIHEGRRIYTPIPASRKEGLAEAKPANTWHDEIIERNAGEK